MHPLTCRVPAVALLFAATATAQNDRGFHLPAGDHRLGELLAQCELALKAPIARDRVDGLDERRPVHLQHALVLPRDQWEDVLASVLRVHDLVLTYDATERRHEVLPTPKERTQPAWIVERAQPLTLAEFTARPDRQGPVDVTLPAGLDTNLATMVLRPFCVSNPGTTATIRGQNLALTGLASGVRAALAVLVAVDPALAAKLPAAAPRPWPRDVAPTQFSLPAGTHTLGQVVDALAKATGCNLLLAADAPLDLTFTTTAVTTGDALTLEAALTSLLWTQHVGVFAAARGHGLLLVRRVTIASRPAPDQAVPMQAEEVLARRGLFAYAEVRYSPRHVDMATFVPAVMAEARAVGRAIGELPSNLELLTTEHGLFLRGFLPELLPIVQKMLEVDRAK